MCEASGNAFHSEYRWLIETVALLATQITGMSGQCIRNSCSAVHASIASHANQFCLRENTK
eukprot:4106519-Amphidinium_carterae.1